MTQKNLYRERMRQAIEALGEKCFDCNTTEGLHLHHVDPNDKIDSVSNMTYLSPQTFWNEVYKCILLCVDCHRIEHKNTKHGTLNMYTHHKCRCMECIITWRNYMLNYMKAYRSRIGQSG